MSTASCISRDQLTKSIDMNRDTEEIPAIIIDLEKNVTAMRSSQ